MILVSAGATGPALAFCAQCGRDRFLVEGSIILSKALRDEGLMGRQTRLFRNYVKMLFGA